MFVEHEKRAKQKPPVMWVGIDGYTRKFSELIEWGCSSFMGYLKGTSALMIFDKHVNLKYKFGNRHFWAEGYYVSTIGLNETTIKEIHLRARKT